MLSDPLTWLAAALLALWARLQAHKLRPAYGRPWRLLALPPLGLVLAAAARLSLSYAAPPHALEITSALACAIAWLSVLHVVRTLARRLLPPARRPCPARRHRV